ncbi:MAG: methyltransferase domain-containing protein [Bacteroidia bacterium]|nr:methyltransferase domain-containing protein [Bacteroidia bacterium]
MDYKLKLEQFNSTEKYKNELFFLQGLLDLKGNEKALDYGCGLGSAMKFLNEETGHDIIGFDVRDDLYSWDKFYFRKEIYFQVAAVYFMHSFSHIPFGGDLLRKVKEVFLLPQGKLVIISPNPEWLALKQNPDYIPDPTVIKHNSLAELIEMATDAGFKVTMSGQFGEEVNGVNERVFIKAVA